MLRLFSPAKINLFLKVLRKEKSGYHSLATLLQTVDLGDTITFELSDRDSFTCSDSRVPVDGSNLISQTVDLFRRKSGLRDSIAIKLEKKIPMAAGLGGGSSNAATTLWALNELTGAKVSEDDLRCWSAEIGSDISFFFSGGLAFCSGRGEQVQNIDFPFERRFFIVKPEKGLSTAEVFAALNLASLSSEDPFDRLRDFLEGKICYYNDLEGAAFLLLSELRDIRDRLFAAGFSRVALTGSGSALFCEGEGVPFEEESVSFYRVKTIRRSRGAWYCG